MELHIMCVLFALILLMGGYHGYRGGLIRSAFKLLGLVAGFVLARPFAKAATPHIEALFDVQLPTYAHYLVVFGCFLAITIAFGLVGWLVSLPIRWSPLRWVDRLVGAGLGIFIGLLVVGLIIGFLDDFTWFQDMLAEAEGLERSFLELLIDITPDLFRNLGDYFDPSKLPTMDEVI